MDRLTDILRAVAVVLLITAVVCLCFVMIGCTATIMVNLFQASEPEPVGNAVVVYQDGNYKVDRVHDEEAGVYCWVTSTKQAGGGIFCLDERSLSDPLEGGG